MPFPSGRPASALGGMERPTKARLRLAQIRPSASPALGLVGCRDAQLAGVSFRAQHAWAVRPERRWVPDSASPALSHAANASCALAARLGFRDPSRLAALFDHDITGVDLDSRLDGRFLMPWEHDEPARMGSHACVLPDREVQHPTAIHADALAYEGVGRLSVAWTLILDPVVYAPCQGLVLRHTALALIIHFGEPFYWSGESAIGTDR